ncbi:thiamine-monophosphate kinase [Bacteroidota bacterium]|nr:thiamine-monophosphate kinase [Bacteroidota bacterium]
MEETQGRTEISELGEFGLIKYLTKNFELQNVTSKVGVGDDAAVLELSGKQTVVTTDLLMEGIHFDLTYVPLRHLGYKAIVVNLSDVYAMNAEPQQVTVSIGISNRFSLEALHELYEGIHHACEHYKVDLVGGDTSSSISGLVISITAIGLVDENKITLRSTAKEHDLICVSGDLGGAYLGLQILEREKRLFLEDPNIQPNLEDQQYIIGRQLKPEARNDVIELLEKLDVLPTSMIDISDGLSSDLLHICTQSNVGCAVYEEKIPISEEAYQQAIKFNLDPVTSALNGGEDYELLFTIKQSDFDKIKDHPDFSVIGHITDASLGTKLITKENNIHDLTAQGWNAFKKNQ